MYKNKLKNKTILIAEDDIFSFQLLSEYFSDTGAHIIHVKTGLEVIEMCKNIQDIDLILMDIKLPEKNGIEATEIIRTFRKEIPILAQTAGIMSNEIESLFSTGINDFIRKPYNKFDILEKVLKLLNINPNNISN